MKKVLFITLIFLFVVTLLIACTTKEIENSNSNNLKEKEIPIDTEITEPERGYNIIEENNIFASSDILEFMNMDDTIDRNYFSPNKQNYIHEQIHFYPDETGALRTRYFFINDEKEELFFDEEYKYLPLEKNFTPNVFWLDDIEVIFGGFHAGTILLDIKSRNDVFLEQSYFGASTNRNFTKIVMNGKYNGVYIYDLFSEEYKEIYKTNYDFIISEMHLNAVWGNNNIIYFDDLILENQRLDEWGNRIYDPKYSIKKYNTETEVTEDFIEHGYILNESPDKRYLTYVDLTKQKTIIFDLTSNETFEIPLSLELEWSADSQQLAYIPNQGKNVLYIENLKQEGREVTTIDISSYLDKNKETLNLQFDVVNEYFTFDIGNYKDYSSFYSPSNKLYYDIVTYKVNMPE